MESIEARSVNNKINNLKREFGNTRIILLGISLLACISCVCIFATVLLVQEQSKEFVVIDGSVVERGSSIAVSTRDHEAKIESPLDDLQRVKFLNLQGYEGNAQRQEVVGFHKVPAKAISTTLVPHEDGFHYFFRTKTGAFAAQNIAGKLSFSPVDDEAVDSLVTIHSRHLLQMSETPETTVEASGEVVATEVLAGMFGEGFAKSRVAAAVDHLYGVPALNCPAGTSQLDANGDQFDTVCGNFAETKVCAGVTAGFYDLSFKGRCLDFCFYYSPESTCGTGYWTCVPHGINEVPHDAGVHDTKFFCEPDGTCAFPRCQEGEGGITKDNWITAVEVKNYQLEFTLGDELFNKAFASCGLVEYFFDGVPYVYYSRETPLPESFDAYTLFTESWKQSPSNTLNDDFSLYNHLGELQEGNVTWQYCDYTEAGQPDVAFPKNCGPENIVPYKNFAFPENGLAGVLNSMDFGFKIYVGDELPCGLWNKINTA
eukprot:CAMPEP_0197855916 /NCGR_PEP_ID=MMETSP1438-20131217/27509_1 /TAXON_ID=1461541 /ORGANISM="Pterosperma sp., Strain CCMP1384" /LENGTH=485 /DNA_ID=CAMNT_0043471179 /DNA_START=78 /DNA_END=1531 /DNA_ORIENTATION=+